jgi:beta-lactam-binding protein with PASTA domain
MFGNRFYGARYFGDRYFGPGAGLILSEIPDVVGETIAYATEVLEDAGFTVIVTYAYSPTLRAGLVISQIPEGGETAESGSVVAIVISLGQIKSTTRVVLVPSSDRNVTVN